jgi:hypothetical protein
MKKKHFLIFCLFLNLNIFAQSKKVVDVVVLGTGLNAEAALQNAFKKAIEQSFGTFISTKTEIVNDEITKNELVSVSNGNIQNYEVLSTAKLNDREVSTTVKVSVSISNLVSFVKSKGINVELKGSLLSANIIQQEFNEINEIQATKELVNTLHDILNKSFDYSIKIEEPTSAGGDQWNIPLITTVQPNENIKIFKQFLLKSLAGLSMTPDEAANYVKLQKPFYKLAIGDESYFDGNGTSRNLFIVSNKSNLTKNNIPQIDIDKAELKKLSELKNKKFYICYSLRGNYEGAGIDTLFVTTNNLDLEIKKIKDLLNDEAEKKLRSSSYTYYTPDMMTFYPIVYWTNNDFVPPVYYFRKLESVSYLYSLITKQLKNILFDISFINEINTIYGSSFYDTDNNVIRGNNFQFLDNDFKLSFDQIYHESNSISLPIRGKYFEDKKYSRDYTTPNTGFDLNKYWDYNNIYYKIINTKNNYGSSTNSLLSEHFESISYPFIDFMKFTSFVNPNTIPITFDRFRNVPKKDDSYVLVLTLDSFKEGKPLYSFNYIDKVTKEELSKISNYTIKHNSLKY